MLKDYEIKKYIAIAVIAVISGLIVLHFPSILQAGSNIIQAVSSLLIGVVIAYILNILLVQVEKIYFPKTRNKTIHKSRRAVCLLISLLILVAASALIIYVVVPELIASFKLMSDEIPPLAEKFRQWIIFHSDEIPSLQQALQTLEIDWQETTKKALAFISAGTESFINYLLSLITGLVGFIVQLVIGFIFAMYILFNKEKLQRQFTVLMESLISAEKCQKTMYVLRTAHQSFTKFIGGQFLEAVILGTLCAIGMMILRLPYAIMTGTVIGVSALIPVIGAYLGAAIGAFMIATVNPMQTVIFLVFIVILQQIEGNLIYPRVVGSSIGLPGIWVFAAVAAGGGIWGIPGIILGVPVAATLYKIIGDYIKKKRGN
ncbi:AI-2E family transporter [Dehalobacterium formicoaceticum]|uniref:AI-2E family transporter n=1 Tax=Dehalobacterium formicoaceticum TaxID=51515 RepID=UPI001FA85E1F|nr:AI-2E family transporter [Dehalobacterium formicoaceticum]